MSCRSLYYYDFIIIGGGVIGCSVAYFLKRNFPHYRVCIIEKNIDVGLEISSHNSGIIHVPFYTSPFSLKSKLIDLVEIEKFLDKFGVPVFKNGMLIVFNYNMLELLRRFHYILYGLINGVRFKILSGKEVKRLEPDIECDGGIFLPDVMVIDPYILTRSIFEACLNLGVYAYLQEKVEKIFVQSNDDFVVITNRGVYFARNIINAAGLEAVEIFNKLSREKLVLEPVVGNYFRVKRDLSIQRPVFFLESSSSETKGINIRRDFKRNVLIGPDAIKIRDNSNLEDSIQKSLSQMLFLLNKYLNGNFGPEDLEFAYYGIRPRIKGFKDFVIKVIRGRRGIIINLLNIDSPGLSAALGISKYIISQL